MASHLLLISCALIALICCTSTTSAANSQFYSKRSPPGVDRTPYSDIVFPNGDGSSTRLVLMPTTTLNIPLAVKYTGTADVISRWNRESILTTGSKSGIVMNQNWRIDQQGTSSNGPNGKSQPGVTWANLQLQYGGTSRESVINANNLRSKKPPRSTSVAEVHAPVGVKFTTKAFQRAFAESKVSSRDGGVQVWMYRVEKSG